MEHMEVRSLRYIDGEDPPECIILQYQNNILETVRMRYEDSTVCRVGHLRIPQMVMTNRQFQDKLERYVPSLIVF